MLISADALSGDVSVEPKYDRDGLIAAQWHSATPGRRPFKGAAVPGAPGWYFVRRTPPVVSGYPMRWLGHFRRTAVAVTVGLVVLSMVRSHWSEELTRATGIVAADTKLRPEVRALEEGNARLSAELTHASTRQSKLESARRLDDTRIDELTAALDAAHRESARLDEAHARVRHQNAQLNQSVTRARAAREAAVAEAEKAQAEMTEKFGAATDAAPRSNAQLASLREELEAKRQELATIIGAHDQVEMKAAPERSEAETERLRTELASAKEQLGQAAGAAIEAEWARQAASSEAGARRSEAARARKELAAARAEVEKTGLEREIAALHSHSKLATEAARQNLIIMAEKIAALNAALDSAHTQEAAPPRSPEAQRDPVADQPATARPAPSATPQQRAAEPASDANAGQHPDSAASVAMAVSMPPPASSPGPEAAARSMLGPNAPIEEPGGPQDTLATVTLQTKPDPVLPDESALLPLESLEIFERLTAERESRPRPVADAPSMTRSQSAMGAWPSRVQESRTVRIQPSRSSPQVGAAPATLGSAAKLHVATKVSTLDEHSALPAGDIRVFIHHVADRQGETAVAQRLADYLRRQGFNVADIRPVDFSIGKPSVRYFFARDRAASQRLVKELRRFGTSLAPDHASDFSHFLPKPRPGNVEVWLPAS
jgi:hypothetical protein